MGVRGVRVKAVREEVMEVEVREGQKQKVAMGSRIMAEKLEVSGYTVLISPCCLRMVSNMFHIK